jgi:hypothetical protein
MIAFNKKQISLVLPLGTLEELLALQTGLLRLLGRQSDVDPLGPEHLAPIADLLEATLFDVEQLAQIETMFLKRATAQPVGQAA